MFVVGFFGFYVGFWKGKNEKLVVRDLCLDFLGFLLVFAENSKHCFFQEQ